MWHSRCANIPTCRKHVIRDLVMMKLHAVGLRGAHKLMPSELSGGMARRVALARAIALDPMLMMYDEPFAGLDPISLGVIGNLIRRLNDALGATSIVVTHDVQESLKIVDYVYFMSDGKIVAQGTPEEMRAHEGAAGAPVCVWRDRWAGAIPVPEQAVRRRSQAGSAASCLNAQSFRSAGWDAPPTTASCALAMRRASSF